LIQYGQVFHFAFFGFVLKSKFYGHILRLYPESLSFFGRSQGLGEKTNLLKLNLQPFPKTFKSLAITQKKAYPYLVKFDLSRFFLYKYFIDKIELRSLKKES